jgi:predicted HicB family RNase H-like nuclease
MSRGRKPGEGTFAGGRPKGSPNKKGSKKQEVYFRCGDELFEALSLAAVAECEQSINIYVRKFLKRTHVGSP